MKKANLDAIQRQGIEAMRFLADATDELALLRKIANLAYEDNKQYIENRHMLKHSDSDLWKNKQHLIKALHRYKGTN